MFNQIWIIRSVWQIINSFILLKFGNLNSVWSVTPCSSVASRSLLLIGSVSILIGSISILIGSVSVLIGSVSILIGNNSILISSVSILIVNLSVLIGSVSILLGGVSILLGRVSILIGSVSILISFLIRRFWSLIGWWSNMKKYVEDKIHWTKHYNYIADNYLVL